MGRGQYNPNLEGTWRESLRDSKKVLQDPEKFVRDFEETLVDLENLFEILRKDNFARS